MRQDSKEGRGLPECYIDRAVSPTGSVLSLGQTIWKSAFLSILRRVQVARFSHDFYRSFYRFRFLFLLIFFPRATARTRVIAVKVLSVLLGDYPLVLFLGLSSFHCLRTVYWMVFYVARKIKWLTIKRSLHGYSRINKGSTNFLYNVC